MTEETPEYRMKISLTIDEWLTVTDELADSVGELEDCMEHSPESHKFYGQIRDRIVKAYIQLINGLPQREPQQET